ncbi:CitMHS family transporter [Bosea vaviloviae]|uniref:Citrate transporter n=1 Tax=Bosea vaviloviae TaxID=1526658 RepID=A0A1D7UCC5_9HYPH|nr:citrate:proton symporter [Bosea vaviloviae]AOO85025.1 citrate transporter [Bosea vaviloviae]
MLTLLAYAMIIVFMTLIMTKRLPALTALILVPILFGLIAGFGMGLGPMMLDGIKKLAPTGVMLMFAILYFGLMIDAGLFDPVARIILKLVGGDPMKIVVGTAALCMAVGLDGDGSTTYMVTAAAMLPLYRRLGMSTVVFACIVIMASQNMNLLPWGGPTARVVSSLGLDMKDVFVPLIPIMIVNAGWVFAVAYILGMRERKRLGIADLNPGDAGAQAIMVGSDPSLLRPKLLWFNFLLTVSLLVVLILDIVPLSVLFIIAFAIAATANYPGLQIQKERIAHHAENVLPVVALIFAAGIFVGILSGTKMVDAIAASVIAAVPDWMGPYMAVVTAVLSVPFTFFISNDAFYFGIVPILAKTAAVYGITGPEIARASLVGQQAHLLSPLVASTYLLVGLTKIEFGDLQRGALLWSLSAALVMLLGNILIGVIPIVGRIG